MVYSGAWVYGARDGYGVQYDGNGHVSCAGTFKNNALINGTHYQYRGNTKIEYVGSFENGFITKGKMYYNGLLYYDGDYDQSVPNGTGTFYWDNCNVRYKGDVKNFKRHGMGESYSSWGYLSYLGEFNNDSKHGIGSSFYDDGKTVQYRGSWMRDEYHGDGTLFNTDGSIQKQGRFSFGVCMNDTYTKPTVTPIYTPIYTKPVVQHVTSTEVKPILRPIAQSANVNHKPAVKDENTSGFAWNRLFNNYTYNAYQRSDKCKCEYSKDSIFICTAIKHNEV
jgi:antitoxin component YwqK of YwqJK toxin-antitoxin module